MVVQFDNVPIVELVHNFNLKLDLLYEVMLNDLGLVNDFDGVDVFGKFVAHFVNLTKAAYTDI